jgi:hypothetical protein
LIFHLLVRQIVPWESFRAEIEAVVLTPDELKKSSAGRKPFDAILIFRMPVLQALTNVAGFLRDVCAFELTLGRFLRSSLLQETKISRFFEMRLHEA